MPGLYEEPATIDAKVLIIGAGFAGFWAALRAAELTDGVVLVDKGYASRAGTSPIMGGVTHAPMPEDDLDAWSAEFVRSGGYMANQDWLPKIWQEQQGRLADYERWGVPFVRDEQGRVRRYLSRGMRVVRCLEFSPREAMKALREQALARGCTILDRVAVTGLLTSDGELPTRGSVVGAVGFDARTGQPLHLRARATILSTGWLWMKGEPHGTDNNSADGSAMAFEAGARLADPELRIHGTMVRLNRDFQGASYNVALAHGGRLTNGRGERFMERYDPDRLERSELPWVVAACLKELIDGRGPVYLDLREHAEDFLRSVRETRGESATVMFDRGFVPDPRVEPCLIEPCSRFRGGGSLRIDTDCRTNIPGLYAAGMAALIDAAGRHNSAGMPSTWCNSSGWLAAESAVRFAAEADPAPAPASMVAASLRRTFEPLQRHDGISADELLRGLARIESNPAWALVVNDAKLAAGLTALRELDDRIRRDAWAPSLHDLVKVHEVSRIVQNLVLGFESASRRTESRDWFNREEYPYVDDQNWHCWHIAQRTSAGTVYERERVDVERYPIKPPAGFFSKPKRMNEVIAIMQGTWAA